jgi:hypothetical protein
MQGMPIQVVSSSGMNQLLVPTAFLQPIFDAIRGLAHAGIRAAGRLIACCFMALLGIPGGNLVQRMPAVSKQPTALPSTSSTRFSRSAAFTLTW